MPADSDVQEMETMGAADLMPDDWAGSDTAVVDARSAHHALTLARELAGTLQQREVVRRILERALSTLDADRATLSRLTPDSLVIEAVAGPSEGLTWVGRAYPLDDIRKQDVVWSALVSRRIEVTRQLDVGRARPEFQAALRSSQHVAVLPLVHEEATLGLLVVSRAEDRPYGEADLAAMELIAGVAAIALRNADLHRALQSSADTLTATLAAARDLAATSGFQDVADSLLRHALLAAHADGGSLMRVEDRDTVVIASTGAGVGDRFPVAAVTLHALSTGEPAELTSEEYVAEHPGSAEVVAGFSRFLILPLIVGGEALGALALGRRADTRFTEQEAVGVRQIGSLAAMLMRNARLLEEAREANDARWTFFNLAVHELRGPLTLIRGYASMLERMDDDVPGPARSVTRTLASSAGDLSNVIDQLLLAARLDTRHLGMAPAEMDLAGCITDAVARGNLAAALRSGSVEAVLPAAPVLVHADPGLVGRILDNLIGNAVKYGGSPPHVQLTVQAGESGAEVRVIDDGDGVPESLARDIFGMFVRGDTNLPGTGLGLYLSRGLAEMMGGSLSLEPRGEPKGSVFLLRLPGARAAP